MTEKTCVIVHTNRLDGLLARLTARFPDIEAHGCDDFESLPALIRETRPDVLYSTRFDVSQPYPRDAVLAAGGPTWVSVGGSGVDHLGVWDPAHVTVTNSAGVAAGMMAEYAFGAFLYFSLDLSGLAKDKSRHHWQSTRQMMPLAGRTLLIVGLGQTGQAVAARAKSFGMTVIGTRTQVAPMENVDEVHPASALRNLWGRADFIVVATPLVASTRGLVDAEAFAAMSPRAVLVDVSRGGVIDHTACLNALRTGGIRGAALDVFPVEPLPADAPVWDMPNVIVSPHCSSVFDGWDAASFDLFLANLARWRLGEPLRNVVDPARGY